VVLDRPNVGAVSPFTPVDSRVARCDSDECPGLSRAAGPDGKVAEMRRIALTLVGALLVLAGGTASASAAPIDVNATPETGGVTVSVSVLGTQVQSITAGQAGGEVDKNAGLCASGLIHNSCTPASSPN
jgi:hypothetical protein